MKRGGKRGLPVIIGIYNHNYLEDRDEGEEHDQKSDEARAICLCLEKMLAFPYCFLKNFDRMR